MNPFFNASGARNPGSAPLTPSGPRFSRVGLSNAVTPSADPMALTAASAGGMGGAGLGGMPTPEQLNDPQFLAFLQLMQQQQAGGQRRGFSGSIFGGTPQAPA